MRRITMEAGVFLSVCRAVPRKRLGQLLSSHPQLVTYFAFAVLERTTLHTSHSRMKHGPYAKEKCRANKARNRRIVRLLKRRVSVKEVGLRFDLVPERVRQIGKLGGVRFKRGAGGGLR
jgi:hypothetical protein